MTDPYTYTEQAITEREKAARDCGPSDWRHVFDGVIVDRDIDGWQHAPDGSVITRIANERVDWGHPSRSAEADHIALHDPDAVLRRCAADRKILERHAECGSGSGYCDDGGHAREGDLACPDLLDLAAGYGWTPDA